MLFQINFCGFECSRKNYVSVWDAGFSDGKEAKAVVHIQFVKI